ncbi:hypothetical protein BC830DRAFT_1086645 [Chytriomyces sp. MP71]|nr:hypothetical protein BC830DRAFT_1086645 [Chytriomyces sp. MP71]
MRYLIRGLGLLLALILAETSGGTILVERQAATPSSSTVGAACPCAAGPGSYGDAKTLFCYANMCLVGSCLNSTLVPSSDGKSCVPWELPASLLLRVNLPVANTPTLPWAVLLESGSDSRSQPAKSPIAMRATQFSPAKMAWVARTCSSKVACIPSLNGNTVGCVNSICQITACATTGQNPINGGADCGVVAPVGGQCTSDGNCQSNADYLTLIHARSVKCANAACAIQDCISGYVKNNGGQCVALSLVGESCSVLNDCNTGASYLISINATSIDCQNGKCAATSDLSGSVSPGASAGGLNTIGSKCGSTNDCVLDASFQTSLHIGGLSCLSGKCLVNSCAAGYVTVDGQTACSNPQKQLDCYVSSDGNILSALNATSADCAAVVTQGVQGPYTCRITACKIGQSPNKDGTSCVAPTYAAVASYDQDNCNGRITSISPGTGDCSQSPSFSCTTSESTLQSNTMQNAPYFSDNTSPTTYRLLNYCWKTSSGSEIYIYHPASSDGRSGSYAAHYKFDDNACITNPTSAGFSYSFTPSFRRRELSTPTSHNLGAIVKLGASCSADTACDWSQFFTGEAKSVGCASGSCRIKACSVGYQPNADGTTCDFVTVTSISKPPLPASTTSSQAGVASSATTSLSNIPSSSSSSSYFVTTDVATSVSSSPRVTTSTSVVSQDSAGFVSAPNIGDQVNASDPPSATPLVLADVSSHFTSVASQGPPKSEPPLSFSGSVQPLVVGATSLIGSTESFNQETFTSSITRGTALLNGGDRLVNGGNLTTGSGNQTLVYLDLDSQGFTVSS